MNPYVVSGIPSISQDIHQRLQRTGRGLAITEAQTGGLRWMTLVVPLLAIALVAEWGLRFDSSTRTIIVALVAILTVLSLAVLVLRPVLRVVGLIPAHPLYEIAARVGAHFPDVRDRLLNLLQIHEEARQRTLYSPELIDASFQDLAVAIQPLDFLESIDRSSVRRASRFLAGSFVLPLFFFILAPSGMTSALNRLLHFGTEFTPPSSISFNVMPGNVEVLKGESVPVTISVSSTEREAPSSLLLRWRPLDQVRMEEQVLRPDSSGFYHGTVPGLRFSTEYFAEAVGQTSPRFLLTLVDRPVIRTFNVRLEFPAYTRLPGKMQDDFVGDVQAPAGTQVSLHGMASKELADGSVVFDKDRSAPMDIRGMEFSYRFRLLHDGTYSLLVKDPEHHTNPDPIAYRLNVIPDESPAVSILQPGKNIDVAGVSMIPLVIQIKDDFGFSQLRIGYRLIQSRYEQPAEHYSFASIPLGSASAPQADVSWSWDISSLRLVPEDVIEYFAEVFDNDAVTGPKSARSSLYLLRLPSLEEVFSDLDKGHEESIDDLKQVTEQAKELKEKLESVNEDFKKNKDIDWRQQKKMEETAKRYQELQKKLEDVKKKVDSMVDEMQKQSVLSPETMEKYLELQQLFEQMDSAELQKALKQMQQSMQNLNREQLQQALQQVSFSEQRFRESIERTLNLLKRIQIEQKLDELKKRANDVAAQQEQLGQETAQSDSTGKQQELSKRQEDLKKSLEKMNAASEDLQNRMEEFFTEMPERELEQANQRLSEKQVGQKMTAAAQQLQKGQPQLARQMQQQIQQDVSQFAQDIDAIQQQMMQRQQQQVLNALRRATNDLLELSKREETLKDQSQSAPPNSSQLRKNAQDQMAVQQDLQNVISALNELSQRSFAVTPEMGKSIGEAQARMQEAMKALDVRSGIMASQEQGKAMGALNKSAMQVQNALQTLMQQGGQGAGSLMGQLQMMAGQQLSINMKTQRMQDAARLAVEQEALRKSLEQLNKETAASAEHERVLGDLQHIADEMKDVVRNLQQNNVNPETVQKQERILSRLLDAARSTRERDFEKRRKATPGTQVARRSPGELDPSLLEGKDRLDEDLLKAIEQGYSKDYQELIRKYFEELRKTDDNRQPQQ